ncbi:MAG: terminase [Lachnospiraceae bacterium]|nr:terminase [Lachnospiraceae bacterium]MBE6026811.1 terminase [Clostridiales bacterium]
MAELRKGSQIPTRSVVLPYTVSYGPDAIKTYNTTGRKALPWQEEQIKNIMAVNGADEWLHTSYGLAVPRQNGKNEVVTMRELEGLKRGERILHTAHKTSTAHAAWDRLLRLVDLAKMPIKSSYKAMGKEHIETFDGGLVEFRTRTATGGLGESYDLIIIDEAQEYRTDHESALKYVISASENPQTIYTGTPPTPVSSGTVFANFRQKTLSGEKINSGWSEWSVSEQHDPYDKDAWYMTNPSLGYFLKERTILDEVGDEVLDFNIQRLGLWSTYNLKSAISEAEWRDIQEDKVPDLKGKLYAGIKFGHDGENVAMSVAVRTQDGRVFVEAIDCRSVRMGVNWIVDFLKRADIKDIVVDGKKGQQLLIDAMKDYGVHKQAILPTVAEIVAANAAFEQGIYDHTLCHKGQPSLVQAISNCEKRAIGSRGGFGFAAQREGIEIALMDSVILAFWRCHSTKERKKQRNSY